MTAQELDDESGKRLQLNPQIVSQMRERWNSDPQSSAIRTMFAVKLDDLKKETAKKFRTCLPDDVKKLQGMMDALDLAYVILTEPLK